MKKRILSGMRPTGPLHIGHLAGALKNWVKLQDEYECYFMIADWHALMSEYEDPKLIKDYTVEMMLDWMSCGIDINKSALSPAAYLAISSSKAFSTIFSSMPNSTLICAG